MTRHGRLITCLTALGFAVASAVPALADITGDALNITAISDAGDVATLQIKLPAGVTSFTWTSSELMEMRSSTTGDLIAVLNPDGRESRVEYVDDPIIGLNFSVQAGGSTTTFVISSGLLSFPTITADGRATTGFSVTDGDGDGATLTGIGDPAGAQGAYLAQYNGFAGTLSGTTFAEVIQSINAGAFASATASADVPPLGFQQIVDPVSDMSVLCNFTLTANDMASATSAYVIVQRPLAVEAETWSRTKALFR